MTTVAIGDSCSIDGCRRGSYHRGWCLMHYTRWLRHGDPAWHRPTPAERFWASIEGRAPSGCWIWRSTLRGGGGYGKFYVGRRHVVAHRFGYELVFGAVPAGLVLDHLCRNRACVNPGHLEPVTMGENIRRGLTGKAATNLRGSDGRFHRGAASGGAPSLC